MYPHKELLSAPLGDVQHLIPKRFFDGDPIKFMYGKDEGRGGEGELWEEEEVERRGTRMEGGILGCKCRCISYNYMPGCRTAHEDKLAPQCSSSPHRGWRAAGVGKGGQVDRQSCRPRSDDSQAASQHTPQLNSFLRVVIVDLIFSLYTVVFVPWRVYISTDYDIMVSGTQAIKVLYLFQH